MRAAAVTMSAAIALGSAVALGAADWPAKPVRVVSPFAPGGTSDTLARLLAGELGERFGQVFFVENRAGAGGLFGSAAVAAVEPDGGTFLVSSIGTHVTSPATSSNPGYDPLRNFTHIAYLGGPPNVIVVHPSLGVKTFQELVVAARRDTVSFISPVPGTIGHLVPELLARRENLKLTHLSYKGAGQAMTDLVAGHVKLGSVTWTAALGQIRAGTVLPLAVSSARLNAGIAAALATPALRTRLAGEGIETEKMSPDEFTRLVASEIARWTPIAKSVAEQGSAR